MAHESEDMYAYNEDAHGEMPQDAVAYDESACDDACVYSGASVEEDGIRSRKEGFESEVPTEHPVRERAHERYVAAKDVATQKKDAAKGFMYEKTPEKLKHPSDLQVRFRTGFVYVTVSVLCVLGGEISTVALLCVLAGISAGEFFYMLRSDAKLPNELLGIIAAVSYPICIWLMGPAGGLWVTGGLLLALLVWYVFWQRARVGDVGVSFFGAAYTGLLLSGLILVRSAIPGFWGGMLVVGIFCSVWANDSFAYLVGRKLGKHKMAPRISPKKSWEGFFGGLIGSAVIWCIMTLIPGVNMSIPVALGIGVVCGLFGVLGDLAESRIKRNSGVKDSGTIMPGHGGLLDRCDSLFLVSAVSAVLLSFGGCIS